VALLTSPNFLYRPELGVPSAAATYRLTGYELASRLAFLLWNSLPDDALLDAAANGALDTSDGVRAEATRMLDAASGRQAVGSFAEELMRLDRIASQAKDAVLYPEYSPTLQQAMVRDVRQAWEDVVFDEQTSVLAVFSTPRVFVNSELAQLYGLDATGLDPNTFEARQLPEGYPRLGLLSKPGFLSQFANQKEGSPTLRGKFMRDALMCTTVPPPPADVDPVFEETATDEPMTKRQRLEQHRADARCAGCHALMDPLGLPFETFDAIGRYRTTDNGLPIDPSGAFDGVEVADAVELAHTIESSTAVARCLTRKYYAYAVGHEERKVDASVIETLYARFESTGFDMRELMLDVVTHEAFSSVAEPL
jgi:hypothetical protein